MAVRELTPAARMLSLYSGQKRTAERLWRDFFSDPAQWWDHRSEKGHVKYPDFKHKLTQESLWLNGRFNPTWVQAELDALAPGAVQVNIFSWNTRLSKYAKSRQYGKCLELFQQMERDGRNPDRLTFVPVLNACAGLQVLEEGRRIHLNIVKRGFETDVYIGNSLIDMYSKCGSIEDAVMVFNVMPIRNVVSWNTMILGHARAGQEQRALGLYKQMRIEGIKPVRITFVGVLNACSTLKGIDEGKQIHKEVIECGCDSDMYVCNSLVDMYAKCGHIDHAWRVFQRMPTRDVVAWNAMILGFVNCGEGQKALDLCQQMQQEGLEPDDVTFVGLLKACSSIGALDDGRNAHAKIIQMGLGSHAFVCNSLINMYAKCGSIKDAWTVFSRIPSPGVMAWNSMILGYVTCGQGQMALDLFTKMGIENVEPDLVTLVGILKACASIGALEEGRRAHEQVIKRGFESDKVVGSTLVDMYAKCGSISDAYEVFCKMPTHDSVAWNTVILGHVKCGQGQKAMELCEQMQVEGVKPDSVTFLAQLNACASVGALEEGRRVHARALQIGLESSISVNNSLIDMYCKCGSIDDAWKVFKKMSTHDVVSWNAMLSGYAMHGHAKEALKHFDQMCQEDVEISRISFVSLLSACSHGGLVDEGLQHFKSMSSEFSCCATVEHYACMVDLLGRSGRLHEAKDLVNSMNSEPNATLWTSFLGACRVHANVELGEEAAKEVLKLDPEHAVGYVLLSNIYAAAEKRGSSANIQRLRLKLGVKKDPGRSWIEVQSKMHSFTVDDQGHPQLTEIHDELSRLLYQMTALGYKPDTSFVLRDVEETEKASRLQHHSEKLAVAFGLMSTPPGVTLRIFKNLRLCGDCHTSIKFFAKIRGREIFVRDANRFHHFNQSGQCSCGDYW